MTAYNEKKNWFREHADTIAILGTFAFCFWSLNEKMNDRFTKIETELAVIKTVLIMKNILPNELACHERKAE